MSRLGTAFCDLFSLCLGAELCGGLFCSRGTLPLEQRIELGAWHIGSDGTAVVLGKVGEGLVFIFRVRIFGYAHAPLLLRHTRVERGLTTAATELVDFNS